MRTVPFPFSTDRCTTTRSSSNTFLGLIGQLVFAMIVCLFAFPSSSAHGQTPFTRPYLPSMVSVEAVRPAYENEAVSSTTGAMCINGSYTLNENTEIVVELPLAHASGDGLSSSTALGNPLVGLALSSTRLPLLVELGGRLPVSDGRLATTLAQAADYGRGASFLEKEIQGYLLGNTRIMLGRDLSVRIRGGLAFSSFDEESDTGDTIRQQDLRLRYGVQFWREGEWLISGLSFTGRGTMTAPGPYDQKSRHHAALTFLLDVGKVAPGLTLGFPLNGPDRDVSLFVFGASLDVRLW